MGPLEQRVGNTRPELRKILKAGLLVQAANTMALEFTVDGVTVTLRERPSVNKSGQLEMWILSAVRDGVALPLGNPYLFVNPPLKLHDGTFHQEAGEDIPNWAEDAGASLQRIVVDVVGR